MPRTNMQVPENRGNGAVVKSALGNGIRGALPIKKASVKACAVPEKTWGVKKSASKQAVIPRHANNRSLLASMDLDEMLEASKNIEIGLRGEKVPSVASVRVQKYVNEVLSSNKIPATRPLSQRMQQDLTQQIIKVNKRTTNAREASRLYRALMKEE